MRDGIRKTYVRPDTTLAEQCANVCIEFGLLNTILTESERPGLT